MEKSSWHVQILCLSCKAAALACPGDDMLGFEALLQEMAHLLHVGRGVLKEMLVSFAQGIEALLASAGSGKAVLGALATAGKEVLALAAIAGQTVALLNAKAEKLGLALEVAEVLCADVA